jgi:transcriptional regulator with XRE-family HTH domain
MATRPKTVTVFYRGIPYVLDLVRCRRALVDRQVDGGLDSMESLAEAVGISRSTASRFFSGKPTSLTVTLKILEVLKLRFDDVAKPKSDEDDTADSSGRVGAKLPTQTPQDGAGSAAIRIHRTGS